MELREIRWYVLAAPGEFGPATAQVRGSGRIHGSGWVQAMERVLVCMPTDRICLDGLWRRQARLLHAQVRHHLPHLPRPPRAHLSHVPLLLHRLTFPHPPRHASLRPLLWIPYAGLPIAVVLFVDHTLHMLCAARRSRPQVNLPLFVSSMPTWMLSLYRSSSCRSSWV